MGLCSPCKTRSGGNGRRTEWFRTWRRSWRQAHGLQVRRRPWRRRSWRGWRRPPWSRQRVLGRARQPGATLSTRHMQTSTRRVRSRQSRPRCHHLSQHGCSHGGQRTHTLPHAGWLGGNPGRPTACGGDGCGALCCMRIRASSTSKGTGCVQIEQTSKAACCELRASHPCHNPHQAAASCVG